MAKKKQALMLSYISFLSFVLIMFLTLYFLMNESALSFISDSLSCIKIVSILVSILSAISHSLNCHYSESFQLNIQAVPVIKNGLFLIFFCFLFHFITILFGAPLFQKLAETFHFAILMTVLVALPCCICAGPSLDDWLNIYLQERGPNIETVVQLSTLGALVGSWLGAVPIPLDWDRPWQAWPVTCCVGSLFGYATGLLLASLYLPHIYQRLNKSKRS